MALWSVVAFRRLWSDCRRGSVNAKTLWDTVLSLELLVVQGACVASGAHWELARERRVWLEAAMTISFMVSRRCA